MKYCSLISAGQHFSLRRRNRYASLTSASLAALLIPSGVASAACTFTPGPGNDVFTCDSGTSHGGLTDTGGSNTLRFPSGGSGTLNGNVLFGAGADSIQMQSGTITGAVDQGDGNDSFNISGGTVAGNVQQGNGIDDFVMTGGQILSLNQGDALDTFFMSGGRIVDAFDDGDRAIMTGGRIGRVNMKLDNNLFDMSGGIIDRNLVTGFGNDTIILSAGTIGGNISVSGGTDSVTVTGGSVGGSVLMSFGTDSFVWDGGGIIYGAIDLGPDNDTARLANLTNANMGDTQQITGGLGIDSLTLDHVATPGVSRLQNWENIAITNDSQLIFDGDLLLGDTGTGTGALTIDATSTLYGGGFNSAISALTAGQFASVTNSGRIDLSNNRAATDTFTIGGNYVGNGGALRLDTVLGADGSASDRLIISGGAASGVTGIDIFNAGGAGAMTLGNGIGVVEASNGATTGTGTFALNSPVAAGAFEYFLFKGGTSAGTSENWYLRSTLVNGGAAPAPAPPPLEPAPQPQMLPPDPIPSPPPPAAQPAPPLPPEATPADPDPVDPAPPVSVAAAAPIAPPPPLAAPQLSPPPPPPVPASASPPLLVSGAALPRPGATRVVGDIVPLYRVEVPTYSAIAPAARSMGLANLGTFHERRGEQSLLDETRFPGIWTRAFGQGFKLKSDGTVAPTIDGTLFGIQVGADIFGSDESSGHKNRAGVLVGYTSINADVLGQALGWNDLAVGSLGLQSASVGAYWSHVGPSGWYLDGLIMGTLFTGSATSARSVGIDIDGGGFSASLEGGYPIALDENWTIEPQAQLIYQHTSLADQTDRFSPVSFQLDDAITGRIGAQLEGSVIANGIALTPYLKANIWHDFGGLDRVNFAGFPIDTQYKQTSLDLGGGVVAKLSSAVDLFATGDYTTNLGGQSQQALEGNIGLRVKW